MKSNMTYRKTGETERSEVSHGPDMSTRNVQRTFRDSENASSQNVEYRGYAADVKYNKKRNPEMGQQYELGYPRLNFVRVLVAGTGNEYRSGGRYCVRNTGLLI